MAAEKLYCGIDIGASSTKVMVIGEDRSIKASRLERTGADIEKVANKLRDAIFEELGIERDDIRCTASTGYGRHTVSFADFNRTEIACHGKGCLHYMDGPLTIVDIGGQDNKIIKLDANGRRVGFKFNRKCAAGTGAFLEEISQLLLIPLSEMNGYAEKATEPVKLGSFCTVFTKTEILSNFKQGDKLPDIIAGAFESVVKRITEMDPLDGNIVLTGGVVGNNPYIVGIFERTLSRPVRVPPHPQFIGAYGAALHALEEEKG